MHAHSKHRHRHFVAFPLFLLVLAVSMSGAIAGGTSALLRFHRAATDVFVLSNGIEALEDEGGHVADAGSMALLERGGALLSSDGIFQVRAGATDMIGMAGAFHVTIAGDQVTVAAISSPVLVNVSGMNAIVPIGTQFSVFRELPAPDAGVASWAQARALLPLPESFFKEKLVSLERFPHVDDFIPATIRDLPDTIGLTEIFEFKAARKRARDSARDELLGAIRYRLEHQDEAGARSLLDAPEYAAALSDNASLPVLVALVARFPDISPGLRAKMLRSLSGREDIWLIGTFHPLLRTALWVNAPSEFSAEKRLLLAFFLPRSGASSEGVPPVILNWWKQTVLRMISEEADPLPLVTELLSADLPLVREQWEQGYPESAKILVEALESFAEPLKTRIEPELLFELKSLRRLTEQELELFPRDSKPASSPQSSSSSSLAAADASRLTERAEADLAKAGALFTTQTSIAPIARDSVHVRTLSFPSPGGDRIFDFDFNVETQEISSIVREGAEMPYALSFDAFLAWVRK